MGSILFLKVLPEFATIVTVTFGFMGKRCICRSHLISFISGMYYHLTKFSGSYFKKITFLIKE